MEGGDSELADFTLPTLKAFLEARSQNVSGYRMPQSAFFPTKSRSSGQPKNDAKALFFPVIFVTATVAAFVLLRNARFNFHCHTQREAIPYSEIGPEVTLRSLHCDFLPERLQRAFTRANQLH